MEKYVKPKAEKKGNTAKTVIAAINKGCRSSRARTKKR